MDLLNYQYLDKMNNNIGILCYDGKILYFLCVWCLFFYTSNSSQYKAETGFITNSVIIQQVKLHSSFFYFFYKHITQGHTRISKRIKECKCDTIDPFNVSRLWWRDKVNRNDGNMQQLLSVCSSKITTLFTSISKVLCLCVCLLHCFTSSFTLRENLAEFFLELSFHCKHPWFC